MLLLPSPNLPKLLFVLSILIYFQRKLMVRKQIDMLIVSHAKVGGPGSSSYYFWVSSRARAKPNWPTSFSPKILSNRIKQEKINSCLLNSVCFSSYGWFGMLPDPLRNVGVSFKLKFPTSISESAVTTKWYYLCQTITFCYEPSPNPGNNSEVLISLLRHTNWLILQRMRKRWHYPPSKGKVGQKVCETKSSYGERLEEAINCTRRPRAGGWVLPVALAVSWKAAWVILWTSDVCKDRCFTFMDVPYL